MLERTNLPGSWAAAKQEAESSTGVKKLIEYLEARGLKDVSPANMVLCLQQAHAVGFKGIPYLDFNTYQGWRAVGKQVKRGEECKIHTITWCASKPKGDADGDAESSPQKQGKVWPKLTYLFHISQCE
jgi:hypothetical protein